MQLSIGAYVYTVRRMWDLRLDGESCDGIYDAGRRVIWLEGALDRERWHEILRHEYQHAWQHHAGGIRSAEDDARFAALIDETFALELEKAGGLNAIDDVGIEGMRPGTLLLPTQPTAQSVYNLDRRVCGNGSCGAELMAGSIESSPPLFLGGGVYVTDRKMECPSCGATTLWRERCTQDGFPLGGIVSARVRASIACVAPV